MGNVNMEAKQIHDRTEAGKHQTVADHLKALDAVAQQIENLPTFTSNDRAFLEELPAFPLVDGKKVLTATTESGDTSLSYEEVENELPADPVADGTKVLTATTTSGETVLSWETPSSGVVDYSTTEVNTGRKWIDGNDIYSIVLTFVTPLAVSSSWVDTGLADTNIGTLLDVRGGKDNGVIYNIFSATKDQNTVRVMQSRGIEVTVDYIILEYTKATV